MLTAPLWFSDVLTDNMTIYGIDWEELISPSNMEKKFVPTEPIGWQIAGQ